MKKLNNTLKTELKKFITYCYKNHVSHFPSSLSMFFFIYQTFSSISNFHVFNGKAFNDYVLDYFKLKKICSDPSLFNAYPIALGYALETSFNTLCFLSDSQITHGRFFETLCLLKKFELTNLVCVIDFNNQRLRNHLDINLETFLEILNSFNLRIKVIDGSSLVYQNFSCDINEFHIIILHTKKGYPFKFIEENPQLYHYRRLDEEFYIQLNQELRKL